MKKILIVDKELSELDGNKRIKIKKDKTIIKDRNYYSDKNFLDDLSKKGIAYKFYLEEWEVIDRSNGRIQLICSNNGNPLRPVHVISDTCPKNGVKALFQSETMVVLKIQNGSFELSKTTIGPAGNMETNVLTVGDYLTLLDIKGQLEDSFGEMVESLNKNYSNFSEVGYLCPIWGII